MGPTSGFNLFAKSLVFTVAPVSSLIALVIHGTWPGPLTWGPWRDRELGQGGHRQAQVENIKPTLVPHSHP